MKTKEFRKITKIVEKLDWTVHKESDGIMFQKYSPAGQDFNVSITVENLEETANELRERCDNFDCSEETYLWLDNTGHGRNGAPYDMKDLYEDMESCLEMMEELCNALEQEVTQ